MKKRLWLHHFSMNSRGTVIPSFAPLDPQWNLESVDEPATNWGQTWSLRPLACEILPKWPLEQGSGGTELWNVAVGAAQAPGHEGMMDLGSTSWGGVVLILIRCCFSQLSAQSLLGLKILEVVKISWLSAFNLIIIQL